ncbi:MAG: MoaD/ThiS family protein [Candidatus Lambdaproteobacteria bacterium]|nr:MoaD/ThiS family protein [Candidatus Lambdaproteobacteria bacterium]
MAIVYVPALMRDLTGNAERVEVELPPGARLTVGALLDRLDARYPGFRERLVENGELVPNIAVFVDGEQSRLGLRERLGAASELHFVPPTMGGG